MESQVTLRAHSKFELAYMVGKHEEMGYTRSGPEFLATTSNGQEYCQRMVRDQKAA